MIFNMRPFLCITAVVFIVTPVGLMAAQERNNTTANSDLTNAESRTEKSSESLKATVNEAFRQSHEGWSSDEVILNDVLFATFIEKCNDLLPGVDSTEFGWTLLNLRKAGQLEAKSTRRKKNSVAGITHIAEIAARTTVDQFRVSTDRIMIDPKLRKVFNSTATDINPDVDLYLVRKAAFNLRKARKLRPELITRIADWNRVVTTHSAEKFAKQPALIPEHPGIYIFRDQSGYLYIGQTENLRSRLTEHLDQSHSHSLAKYLTDHGVKNISIEVHSFDPDSRAREIMVRRAYESELIASRKPRFNIQP